MQADFISFPHRKKIIAPSTWTKKKLADVHVEALLLCGFKCAYCSSNSGRHIKTMLPEITEAVKEVTGNSFNPHATDGLTLGFEDIVRALEAELSEVRNRPGAGKTLVYSQLTDGFSPEPLRDGTTRGILKLLVEKTDYRIRILTKNAIVASRRWMKFFLSHPGRFVVGLSIGTLDDKFGHILEKGTSRPSSRIAALRALQDAGVPTFGMLCPVFPEVLQSDQLERLMAKIRPELCENVWAEPYNNRQNWSYVRQCFESNSFMRYWMSQVFEQGDKELWSRYATELYTRVRDVAKRGMWIDRLNYLLYEGQIVREDAERFSQLEGVLLQSKDDGAGVSQNPAFAKFQVKRSANSGG